MLSKLEIYKITGQLWSGEVTFNSQNTMYNHQLLTFFTSMRGLLADVPQFFSLGPLAFLVKTYDKNYVF